VLSFGWLLPVANKCQPYISGSSEMLLFMSDYIVVADNLES